jgi:AcrR family transcriptional regulator
VSTVNIVCDTDGVTERPYHHGALESALVDAAMDVVLVDGVGALALRDLARTIGVSPSATYRHFPSRDHLVAAVSQQARQQLATALLTARSAVSTAGPRASTALRRLRAIGRAYIEFAVRNPKLFEAAFTPAAIVPATAENPNAWSVLVASIEELVDTGAVSRARQHDATLIAWSSVHGLATILTASARPSDSTLCDVKAGVIDPVVNESIDAVIDGVVRAIS